MTRPGLFLLMHSRLLGHLVASWIFLQDLARVWEFCKEKGFNHPEGQAFLYWDTNTRWKTRSGIRVPVCTVEITEHLWLCVRELLLSSAAGTRLVLAFKKFYLLINCWRIADGLSELVSVIIPPRYVSFVIRWTYSPVWPHDWPCLPFGSTLETRHQDIIFLGSVLRIYELFLEEPWKVLRP